MNLEVIVKTSEAFEIKINIKYDRKIFIYYLRLGLSILQL